jgi:hypothetical protein
MSDKHETLADAMRRLEKLMAELREVMRDA